MPENTAETESGAEQAQPVVLKVVQKKAPELTDDRAGDSLAVLAYLSRAEWHVRLGYQ